MVVDPAPLMSILRSDQILTADNTNYCLPDERALPVVLPETLAETSAIVQLVAQQGWSLVVVGQGSKLHLGNPLRRADLLLATTRLPSVLEHAAADLTARVSAGYLLRVCQAQFALAGQFLPVVPMQADVATMGGLVAANSYNQLRLAYGSIRDWLIGITVINSRGELVKAGGQVVKNVAGYDLMKLYTGSLGTLGIIVEMNVKLRPKPLAELTWHKYWENFSQAWQIAQTCLTSQIAPGAVDLLNQTALQQIRQNALAQTGDVNAAQTDNFWARNGAAGGYYLLIRYLGRMATIQSQVDQTQQLTNTTGELLTASQSATLWSRLTTFGENAQWHLRASLRPQYLPQLLDYLETQFPPATAIWGQLGTGVVQIATSKLDKESRSQKTAVNQLSELNINDINKLRDYLRHFSGTLVVERAPKEWRAELDVWGDAPAQFLMQRIKQALDPQNIFSPGRFVGGI